MANYRYDVNKHQAESTKSVAELMLIMAQASIPGPKSCQFPSNSGKKFPKFAFECKEPLIEGKSYCKNHCKICYTNYTKTGIVPNYNPSLSPSVKKI